MSMEICKYCRMLEFYFVRFKGFGEGYLFIRSVQGCVWYVEGIYRGSYCCYLQQVGRYTVSRFQCEGYNFIIGWEVLGWVEGAGLGIQQDLVFLVDVFYCMVSLFETFRVVFLVFFC